MNDTLKAYLLDVSETFQEISDERKQTLDAISSYIAQQLASQNKADLVMICTHNSRRSQFAQAWSLAAAHYYGVRNVHAYSGGTEVTALFPEVSNALATAGFTVFSVAEGKNPVFGLKYAPNEASVLGFSKLYQDPFNVTDHFAAIMTCSSADAACPHIPEADARYSLPYEDPKASDFTSKQEDAYRATCRLIAREFLYIFSKVKKESL